MLLITLSKDEVEIIVRRLVNKLLGEYNGSYTLDLSKLTAQQTTFVYMGQDWDLGKIISKSGMSFSELSSLFDKVKRGIFDEAPWSSPSPLDNKEDKFVWVGKHKPSDPAPMFIVIDDEDRCWWI